MADTAKPTIAVGTFTITELYAGRTVESDHVFMVPADDLILLMDGEEQRTVLPSKEDVRRALEIIERANGADLDEWTMGVLPSDDTREALFAIRASKPKIDSHHVNGGAFRVVSLDEWRALGGDGNQFCDWHEGIGYVVYDAQAREQYEAKLASRDEARS
ncbi:hypothetical protein RMR10_004445 [Agrobacterium rosae]|uniref:hypothetical protein n=1 Tax=Agrobacterium rosae TaxID=1972867 RepID=UPI002A160884|nr:hypothetical protein [Agrobacterium rosae]MDX8315629.1 hypothetical protein [Agrobacterium rosae]